METEGFMIALRYWTSRSSQMQPFKRLQTRTPAIAPETAAREADSQLAPPAATA